jgi:hypothetical protein
MKKNGYNSLAAELKERKHIAELGFDGRIVSKYICRE